MTLKYRLKEKLEKYQEEREEHEQEIAELKEEIENAERLLNRSERNMFEKGETKLTGEEAEQLNYEIIALKDLLMIAETQQERNISDINIAKAKIETLNSIAIG